MPWPKWLRKTGSGVKAAAQNQVVREIGGAVATAASPRAAAILKALKDARASGTVSDQLDELLAETKANGEKLDAILLLLSEAVEE